MLHMAACRRSSASRPWPTHQPLRPVPLPIPPAGVYVMAGGFCSVLLIFSLWCYPETRGLSLDEVQEALRQHWL